jgi:hypothetical protein
MIVGLQVWKRLYERLFSKSDGSIIEFYQRLIGILEIQGFQRLPFQTPLEFAHAVDMAEAISITQKYQQVRFGGHELSRDEADEISVMLERLETRGKRNE